MRLCEGNRRFLRGREAAEVRPYFIGDFILNCARVRSLVGKSKLVKIIENGLALDLQLARQIVDSNLSRHV